jgi:hypothetical protein
MSYKGAKAERVRGVLQKTASIWDRSAAGGWRLERFFKKVN